MINPGLLLIIAILIVLPFVTGCSRDGESPDSAEDTVSETSPEEAAAPSDEYENDPADFDAPDLPSLSEVQSVSIEMLTGGPRRGFKAVVAHTGPEDMRFLYRWTLSGRDISAQVEETLPWGEGFKKGDTIGVSVTPYSDLGQGVMSVEGSFRIPNSPPVITSSPAVSFKDGVFSYTVEAEDPDGDPLDYAFKNAPPGMTIEPATGLIEWEYGAGDAGEHKVTIVVSDSEGAHTVQEISMNIDPEAELSE